MMVIFRGGVKSRYSIIIQWQHTHLPPSCPNYCDLHVLVEQEIDFWESGPDCRIWPRSAQGSGEGAMIARLVMVGLLGFIKIQQRELTRHCRTQIPWYWCRQYWCNHCQCNRNAEVMAFCLLCALHCRDLFVPCFLRITCFVATK